MSSKGLKDFVDQIAADDALREELRAKADEQGFVAAAEVFELATARGYEFQVEDISNELGDDELDSVSGGAYVFPKVEIDLNSTSLTDTSLKFNTSLSSLYFKL